MRKDERLRAELDLMAGDRSVTVEQMMEQFAISAATARRDLDELASQQLIARTHGGAVAHTVAYELPLRYRVGHHRDQKGRVAKAAAEMIDARGVIGLNGGTTTTEVARCLAARVDPTADSANASSSLTIVTNALNIANELAVRPQVKVVVVGGVLRPQSFELVGPFAGAVLDGLSLDVVFLGVDALSAQEGAAASHEGEAEINRVMVRRAGRVIVVADSSKLGRRAFCTICAASDIDVLVTDNDADQTVVGELRQAGVEVLLA